MPEANPAQSSGRIVLYRCPGCGRVQSWHGRCRNAFAHKADERVLLEPGAFVLADDYEQAVQRAGAAELALKQIADLLGSGTSPEELVRVAADVSLALDQMMRGGAR